MTWFVFDCETTGFPAKDKPRDDPTQPHIVQLAAVLADNEFREMSSLKLLVQPNGWVIPPDAERVHGISTERAQRYGIPLLAAMLPFLQMANRCAYHVAYNHRFDSDMVRLEVERLNAERGSSDKGLDYPGVRVIDPIKLGATLQDDGRYVSLAVLHRQLFGWDYPEQHDGLQDARAALRLTREFVNRRMVEL